MIAPKSTRNPSLNVRKVGDQTTVWMRWTEEQRAEALRNTEARVRWRHQENFTIELRLEAGGRYTHTTRSRHTANNWEDHARFHGYGGGGDDHPILPPPPPSKEILSTEESQMTGRWELNGSTLTLHPEVYNGKHVPTEDRKAITMTLEDGALRQDHQYVHIYRRASK